MHWAIWQQMKSPPKGFEDVVRTHFRQRRKHVSAPQSYIPLIFMTCMSCAVRAKECASICLLASKWARAVSIDKPGMRGPHLIWLEPSKREACRGVLKWVALCVE